MPVRIGCVVEGHSEVESVPALIRRIAEQFNPPIQVRVPHPVRVTKSKLLKSGELERAIDLTVLNIGREGGVLVLLDSDEDCPARLGPELHERVRRARPDLPSAVVVAKREFESWFLASAETLRGRRGLADDLESPSFPEEIPGAKEWLRQRNRNSVYSPAVDQVPLVHFLDFGLARRASSFENATGKLLACSQRSAKLESRAFTFHGCH